MIVVQKIIQKLTFTDTKKTQLIWNCFDEDISADILIGDVILPFRDQNNFKRPKINWFDLILKNTNSRFD